MKHKELRHYLTLPARETLCGTPGDVTSFASKTTCPKCRALFEEKGIAPDLLEPSEGK